MDELIIKNIPGKKREKKNKQVLLATGYSVWTKGKGSRGLSKI